jgi:hypothetical protein
VSAIAITITITITISTVTDAAHEHEGYEKPQRSRVSMTSQKAHPGQEVGVSVRL